MCELGKVNKICDILQMGGIEWIVMRKSLIWPFFTDIFFSNILLICQKSSAMTPTFFILFFMHTIQTRCTRCIMTLTRPVFCQFKYYFRIHSKLSKKWCYFFTETSRNEHQIHKFNKFLYDGIKVDNFTFLSLCHSICYKKNLLCKNLIT